MVKRQNRVNDPASDAPRESQRQKGETPNSKISGPHSLGWERWTSCTLPHFSRAHRAAACMLYGPLIQHLQMLIEVAGRKRKAQTKTTYGLQSAAGYGRIHAEPWMTAGKTARAPGTPQYQAASDIARPSVVIAGWPPCPEPERFLSRRRRTTLGGIRAISDADEHPARAGHLHFNPPRTEDWQPCELQTQALDRHPCVT